MNDDFRSQLFNTFRQKETSELVEIWQRNDHSEWSETAFDVIQEILLSRLGKLPSQNQPVYESIEDIDHFDKRIKELLENRDIDGLAGILENETDSAFGLEVAKVLAKLGDERGLDYLINALEIKNKGVDGKSYVISYISFIVICFIVSLIFSFLPFPYLYRYALELVAGFFIFKFVIKSEIINLA
jgi:HEAT repeat protein